MPTIIIVAVLVLFAFFLKLQSQQSKDLYKLKPLMTDNEKEFYVRLVEALPNHYIFSQVALGALLQPNIKGNNRKYYSVRGTFSQKIADYVVCDKAMKVVAIVELDDRTHNASKDGKRDLMLEQAGYTVVRWNSKKKPTAQEIAERFKPEVVSN